jgi:hypothetical protein
MPSCTLKTILDLTLLTLWKYKSKGIDHPGATQVDGKIDIIVKDRVSGVALYSRGIVVE